MGPSSFPQERASISFYLVCAGGVSVGQRETALAGPVTGQRTFYSPAMRQAFAIPSRARSS